MIFQIQFLSSLRLLEANISDPLRGLLDKIKWLNLHFDAESGIPDCQASLTTAVQSFKYLGCDVLFLKNLFLCMYTVYPLKNLICPWFSRFQDVGRTSIPIPGTVCIE